MRTLANTIRDCSLPREPFLRLIDANRRDQVVTRYDAFEELLEYCDLSAAPVGLREEADIGTTPIQVHCLRTPSGTAPDTREPAIFEREQ